MTALRGRPWALGILVAIVAFGLYARASGHSVFVPGHVDEPALVQAAADLIERGSLEPTFYNHPNHFGVYANAIAFSVVNWWNGTGLLPPTFAEGMVYYETARFLTAVYGTLVIVVAFLIGAEFDRWIGVVAAALFAVNPLYVHDAHIARSDDLHLLFTMLVVLFLVRYLKRGRSTALIAAAACAGLSVSAKYPGAFNCFLVAAAIAVRSSGRGRPMLREAAISAAAFFAALFASAPYLFLRFPILLEVFRRETRGRQAGMEILGWSGNLQYYGGDFLLLTNVPLLLFAAIGAWAAVEKYGKPALPLFFGLVYWILLSALALHWRRWGYPMYATPLLLAAFGLVLPLERLLEIRERGLRFACAAAYAAIVVATVAYPLLARGLAVVAELGAQSPT